LKLALFALALPAGAFAQLSFLQPFADPSPATNGPAINSVSTYTGVYALGHPSNLVGEAATTSSAGMMVVGGAAVDLGWYATGRQSQAFVDYSLAYNGNAEFSRLGGFDNSLVFGAQTKLSPRVTLVVDGQAESITFAGFLYEPSSSLSLAEQAGTISQLAGSPAETLAGTGATISPLSLTLYGARRRDAFGAVRLIFASSRRTTWTLGTRFERDLPSAVEEGVAGSIAYPGISAAAAALGFAYSLSPRSRLEGQFSSSRSFWMGRGVQAEEGRIGIGRELSPHWFARIGGGYGGMTEFPSSLKVPFGGTFVGAAGVGAKLENNTLAVSASRSVSDAYGLGASDTTNAQLGWTWARPGSAWTLAGTVAYQRLEGTLFGLIQGWFGQVSVTRRINRQLTLLAQGTYATDAGVAGGDFASLMRRGVRVSLTWRPKAGPSR
jgi:hypothetical protein